MEFKESENWKHPTADTPTGTYWVRERKIEVNSKRMRPAIADIRQEAVQDTFSDWLCYSEHALYCWDEAQKKLSDFLIQPLVSWKE